MTFRGDRPAVAWFVAATFLLAAGPDSRAQERVPGAVAFERGTALLAGGDPWRASKHLEQALAQGYPAADGYLRLADSYLALDHRLFDARTAIERSLAADDTRVDVWYRLATINIRIDGMDAETRARRALREVVRRDPRHRDALERWRQFYLDPDDSIAMAGILADHLERRFDPELALARIDILVEAGEWEVAFAAIEDARRHAGPDLEAALEYHAGVALAATGAPAEGWRRYRAGLGSARSDLALALYRRDLEPVLPDSLLAVWETMSREQRRDVLIGWWNARDPLPLDEVNDRWVEQQRRIRFAQTTFRFKKAWRLERFRTPGAAAFGRPTLAIRHGGRPLDDRAEVFLRHGFPDAQGGVGRDECGFWYYARSVADSSATFAINFQKASPFDDRIRFVGNDCIYSDLPTTGAGLAHFAPGGIRVWDQPRILARIDRDRELALGTDSYRFEIEHPIEVLATPLRFLDAEGVPELWIYVAVPVEAVERPLRWGAFAWDDAWLEAARVNGGGEVSVGPTFVHDVARLRLPMGSHRLALHVKSGDRDGVWRGSTSIDLRPAELGMSDLVVASAHAPRPTHPRFVRHGFSVVPHPGGVFSRGATLALFYEVYGLGPDDTARVDYRIDAAPAARSAFRRAFSALAGLVGVREEASAITFSFDRSGEVSGVVAERLTIDTEELPGGIYTLRVEVTTPDGTTRTRTGRFTLR